MASTIPKDNSTTGETVPFAHGNGGNRSAWLADLTSTKESLVTTFHPKSGDITRKWYVIDATDVVLGRLAVTAADLLRGKKKPYFAPNVDCGDNVIIINADKVRVSSNKRDREMRYRHSGYPGGLKSMTLGRSLDLHPERVIEESVKGMMPSNKLSRASIKKLHVFAGPEHTYQAQKPETFEIKQVAQ
ncbi:50S ribosomal protein L13 [Corynebacterium heidelbergense]|nr:50S ribosomal protein L13 [Corynebacterium heidelbergense]